MEVRIRHEGVLEVHAPNSFSLVMIEGFLKRKAKWIGEKLAMFRERQSLLSERSSSIDKKCFYLGESRAVKLAARSARWGRIIFDSDGWVVEVPAHISASDHQSYAHEFLEKWFKSHALVILKDRVKSYAHLMGDEPGIIRIRSPKGLWGSCHPIKRTLHFNWKIIMAPIEVIDYLVVHELSHLRVADHSQKFWARVERYCPGYKLRQEWLKRNGYQLRLPFAS